MDTLFFISIGCFFALFVAALAIARHLRIETVRSPQTSQPRPQLRSFPRNPPPQPRHDLPEQQVLHHLAQGKQPDWRFLISEQRRRRQSRGPYPFPSRKPPASVGPPARQHPHGANLSEPGDLQPPLPDPFPSSGTYGKRP